MRAVGRVLPLLAGLALQGWVSIAVGQTVPIEGAACMPHPGNGNGNICSAKDLEAVAVLAPGAPASCEEGETFTATVRFIISPGAESVRAASERYTLGFAIGENGGPAIDSPGTCTVSYLTPNSGALDLTSGVGPYRELSQGSGDACGDIDSSEQTYHDVTTTQFLCKDSDGDGRVDFDAVVTWENNKSDLCSSPPIAADFYPDQSSKCLGGTNLDLDIPVEQLPTIEIDKLPLPDTLEDPGGQVVYSVGVTNTSGISDSLTITSLVDDVVGNLDGMGTCSVGVVLEPGGSYRCEFADTHIGIAGDTFTNTVTVVGTDEEGSTATAAATATVTIIAGPPAQADFEILKKGYPSTLSEPGGEVEYTIGYRNTGEVDLRITDIQDDQVGGSLNGVGNCAFPVVLGVGLEYQCQYEQLVTGAPGDAVTNTVTATAITLGVPFTTLTRSSDYTVEIVDVPSVLLATKVALKRLIPDPGPLATDTTSVEYRLGIINASRVDTITVNSLTDIQQAGAGTPSDVDLTGLSTPSGKTACTVPLTLAPLSRQVCFFERDIIGDQVVNGDVVSNTARVEALDDDGMALEGSGAANVYITDLLLPRIDVTKTPSQSVINAPSETVTFDVEILNTGFAAVTINSIEDSVDGGAAVDVTTVAGTILATNCSVPVVLAPGGSTTCGFDVVVAGSPGDTVPDQVTVAAQDNQGNSVSATADAEVAIINRNISIDVDKIGAPRGLLAPGGDFDYSVIVTNTSGANNSLTITSLVDDVVGDLNGQGTCATGAVLAPGATYECEFTDTHTGNAGDTFTNTVSVTGTDADGFTTTADASETVQIFVGLSPGASFSVIKTGRPSVINEPGGDVTYVIGYRNTGIDAVRITDTVDDQVGGSLDGVGTCVFPFDIAQGGAAACQYVQAVAGDPGDTITNTVLASGEPVSGSIIPLTDSASSTVEIVDVPSAMVVSKVAFVQQIPDPGPAASDTAPVEYRLTVTNSSQVDTITVNTLTDSQVAAGGAPSSVDLTSLPTPSGKTACEVPVVLAPGAQQECFFERDVIGDQVVAGDTVVNTAEASATDDDGQSLQADSAATVTITDVRAATIEVVKTPSDNVILAPSQVVTFTVDIINSGNVEITVTGIVDSVDGGTPVDVTTISSEILATSCAVPLVLDVGDTATCTFDSRVSGLAGSQVSDKVTVTGEDSGGNEVTGFATADVALIDSGIDIDVDKTPSSNVIFAGESVTFTYRVINDSTEPVVVDRLVDDQLGDLDGQGSCVMPQSLGLAESSTDSYTCQLTASATGGLSGLYRNQATASATRAATPLLLARIAPERVYAYDNAFVFVLPSVAAVAVPLGGGVVVLSILGLLYLARRRLN